MKTAELPRRKHASKSVASFEMAVTIKEEPRNQCELTFGADLLKWFCMPSPGTGFIESMEIRDGRLVLLVRYDEALESGTHIKFWDVSQTAMNSTAIQTYDAVVPVTNEEFIEGEENHEQRFTKQI